MVGAGSDGGGQQREYILAPPCACLSSCPFSEFSQCTRAGAVAPAMTEEISVQTDATAGPSSHSWTQGHGDRIQTQVRVSKPHIQSTREILLSGMFQLRAWEDEAMWNLVKNHLVLDGWRVPDACGVVVGVGVMDFGKG